jgi:hypothetical protein
MHMVYKGNHGQPAVIYMLPWTDLKSTNEFCIYLTQMFVCWQAQQLGVAPCMTFDHRNI